MCFTGGHTEGLHIHGWAIAQLLAMRSADGDRALARYFAELDKLDRENILQEENEAWTAYYKIALWSALPGD